MCSSSRIGAQEQRRLDVLKVECECRWAQLTLLQTSCNHIIWGRRQFLGQNLGQCRVIEVVRPGAGQWPGLGGGKLVMVPAGRLGTV